MLHPVGYEVAHLFHQTPAVLALDRAEKSQQIIKYLPLPLRKPERGPNSWVQLFDVAGPLGHFRHRFRTLSGHMASLPRDGLFYIVDQEL